MNNERPDRFEERVRRQSLRVIGKVLGIALSLGVCMWLFIAWSLWSEYKVARAVGRTEGYNLTAGFALELTSNLDSASAKLELIDIAMKGIPSGAPDDAVRAHLRQAVAPTAEGGTNIRIAGLDGHRIWSTFEPDPGPTDFHEQPHFVAHHDDPSVGLIVDRYAQDATGRTFTEVSRRLESVDGHFAGEAMLLLKPGNLITLVRQVDLGRRGLIAVVDADGIVRAGYDGSHSDGTIGVGTDLRGGTYPENIEPGETVSYTRVGRLVPIDQLITMRRLQHYPLRVAVALDLDDVLGSARTHIVLMGLVGVGATSLIAILTLLLMREVWRRTKREIELAYDRARLRSAQVQIEADRARLAETNRELLASKEIAEAANRARSQFLAHMSHELRTPLHAIIGFSELIQDQAPTKPGSPPIAGYAADIWSSGRHLLELINSILDISKVESGTATLSESAFPLADVARSSLRSVRSQAEARNISIDLRLPEAVVRLRADRTRLLQILINLLSNAVKFTPDHGRIAFTVAEAMTGELVFTITDTGIGMTEAEIKVALEPFGQVDSALSRSFEGTGLGLPLARKLAELHGGRLELTSIKGTGTIAKIILPAERLLERDGVRMGGI